MSHNFYKKYKKEIDRFIDQALIEDIENLDHTSKACLDDDLISSAKLDVKEDCIIAGIDLAEKIYCKIDSSIKVTPFSRDGNKLTKGSIAFTVKGPAKSLLASERLVLNCMQKMSGIASLANHFNKKIKEIITVDKISTSPALEKKAQKAELMENIESAIMKDSLVKELISDFNAEIIPSSIEPIKKGK